MKALDAYLAARESLFMEFGYDGESFDVEDYRDDAWSSDGSEISWDYEYGDDVVEGDWVYGADLRGYRLVEGETQTLAVIDDACGYTYIGIFSNSLRVK